MENKKEDDLIRVIGSENTIIILQFLNIFSSASYDHLCNSLDEQNLNEGLEELLDLDLIKTYSDKRSKKKWYEITERGKKVLRVREEIAWLVSVY